MDMSEFCSAVYWNDDHLPVYFQLPVYVLSYFLIYTPSYDSLSTKKLTKHLGD